MRRIRRLGQVAHMQKSRKVYKGSEEKPEGM
jgi:hypothetical protein